MDNRTKDERRVDCCDGEVRLLLLEELPSGALSEGLAGCAVPKLVKIIRQLLLDGQYLTPITICRVLEGLLVRQRVPVTLRVRVIRPCALIRVDDGSKGRSNDDLLHRRSALFDGLQNASCANDSRVKQLLLDVGHVEVERACGVDDSLKWRIGLDCLIKSAFLRNILDNGEIKLVLAIAWVSFLDLVGLVLAAGGRDNGVTGRL